MKRKITIQFVMLTVVAIAATVLIITAVFYKAFREEVLADLKTSAYVLEGTDVFDDPYNIKYDSDNKNLRITVISQNGKVVFDNEADVIDMDNHGNRPEVEAAFASGEGSAVRKSKTLGRNAFYYAIHLNADYVLRVAKESDSIWSLFSDIVPVIILIVMMIIGIVFMITHFLTESIVRPVEQLANNMDNLGHQKTYSELQPFIDTIMKQHEDLKKTSLMRQEFTANVSHELKTPLTSISGYAELIESGMADKGDIKRFAGEIHRNANRLLTLINDTIKLSEMDVSQEAPEMEKIDLDKIAENIISTLQMSADKNNVVLKYKGETAEIEANRMMMEELVYNLTDNAIRYNRPKGRVDVSISNKNGFVVLKVRDTGIGIPKKYQTRIFERFYRVDKSRSKQTGGTGLGLAIVKHIVAQHKAEISVDSEVGKGTEIKVKFKQ